MVYRVVVSLLVGVMTLEGLAQTKPPSPRPQEKPLFGFWLSAQAQRFGNFFQAPEGTPEQDVLAGVAEVGASVRLGGNVRAYGSYNYVQYDDEQLDRSDGFRIGARMEGKPHAFDVYLEQLKDRPTFDVGDTFDRADVRTLAGEYSYRFFEDWQASVDGELQEQEMEITAARNNEYRSVGGAVRYRGWRIFSPEIGYRTAERDVDDATQSYDQRDLYLQIRSSVTPALYLSLRFRDRTREYPTASTTSSNFGREDKRRQITAAADWNTSQNLTWNFYYARENVDINQVGRDFDTTLLLAGLTWRF